MIINNKWIGYIERSYSQIKTSIINAMKTETPEITDHSESNPYIQIVSIFAAIAESLNYYIDRNAEERFLSTCKRFDSAVKIAKLYDYRIRGVLAYSVTVKFTINAVAGEDVNIPEGTIVSTPDGIQYRTLENATIVSGQTFVTVDAKNWKQVTNINIGTSDGSQNQTFEIANNVVDQSITCTVNGDNFLPVNTFAYSNNADKVFRGSLNESGNMEVQFGDGVSGEIPTNGEDIILNYFTSDGESGKITTGAINEIVSNLTLPDGVVLSVTNEVVSSGGAGNQTLQDLKRLIPISVRTKDRAVTRQDYSDIVALAPGVAKAGIEFSCGKSVDIYIAPIGGGVASGSVISDAFDYIDERRMITTNIAVYAAGEIAIKITANIYAQSNYSNSLVEQNVKNALVAFGSVDNQNIRGKVSIGDIYEVMETTEGVEVSELVSMVPVPYARPLSGSNILNWDRAIPSTSESVVKWQIRLTGANTFDLIKGDSFLGNYNTGVTITFDEIIFTVNGSYTTGDRFEFFTYPYTGSVNLSEPSIPVINIDDINLTVLNGVV